jgi:hypothetical protein
LIGSTSAFMTSTNTSTSGWVAMVIRPAPTKARSCGVLLG